MLRPLLLAAIALLLPALLARGADPTQPGRRTVRRAASTDAAPTEYSRPRSLAGQWQPDRSGVVEPVKAAPAETDSRARDLRSKLLQANRPSVPWRPNRSTSNEEPLDATPAPVANLIETSQPPEGERERIRLAQFQAPGSSGVTSPPPTTRSQPTPGSSSILNAPAVPSTSSSPGRMTAPGSSTTSSPGFGSMNQSQPGFGSMNQSQPGFGSFQPGQGSFDQFSGNSGASSGGRTPGGSSALASSPNMIGDIFSPGGGSTAVVPGSPIFGFNGMNTTVIGFTPTTITLPTPGSSVTGRQKIAENTSPIPQDRVFVNYSYFDNVPLLDGGVDINRVTPGFEKTFMCGRSSVELRVPFADTLSSDMVVGQSNNNDWEMGNLYLTFKSLFYTDRELALSGGIGITVPTADDLRVFNAAGQELVRIENESMHLLPFVGFLYAPNDTFFSQGHVQADLDATGNSVLISNGFTLNDAGNVHDMNFVYIDYGLGAWLFHDNYCCTGRALTGVAPTAELHYSLSLNDSDTRTDAGGQFRVGTVQETVETLNLVLGCTFELYGASRLTLGFATPLINDQDTQFDYEVRVMFNRYFGPSGVAARSPYARSGFSY